MLAALLLPCAQAHAAEPQIAAGRYMNLALDKAGTVFWWGDDYGPGFYQIGSGQRTAPIVVGGLPRAKAIAVGEFHALAVGEDGGVYEWGFSPFKTQALLREVKSLGACEDQRKFWTGHGRDPCDKELKALLAQTYLRQPLRVEGVPAARAVAATEAVSVMIDQKGDVYCWDVSQAPQRVPGLDRIKAIALGHFHALALRQDGSVLSWGSNVYGQLGQEKPAPHEQGEGICTKPNPQRVLEHGIAIAASAGNSFVLQADGTVWGMGDNTGRLLSVPDAAASQPRPVFDTKVSLPRAMARIPGAVQLSGDDRAVMVLDRKGVMKVLLPRDMPGLPPADPERLSLSGIAAVSTSFQHHLALARDGHVCAWGDNTYGQTVPNSKLRFIPTALPVALPDDKAVLTLAGHGGDALALCGSADWRAQLGAWEQAERDRNEAIRAKQEVMQKQWERENAFGRQAGLGGNVVAGETALITAINNRNQAALLKLLDMPEVDINGRDRSGNTPLMRAATSRNLEAFKALLAHGADLTLKAGDKVRDLRDIVMREKRPEFIEALDAYAPASAARAP